MDEQLSKNELAEKWYDRCDKLRQQNENLMICVQGLTIAVIFFALIICYMVLAVM